MTIGFLWVGTLSVTNCAAKFLILGLIYINK